MKYISKLILTFTQIFRKLIKYVSMESYCKSSFKAPQGAYLFQAHLRGGGLI